MIHRSTAYQALLDKIQEQHWSPSAHETLNVFDDTDPKIIWDWYELHPDSVLVWLKSDQHSQSPSLVHSPKSES